jgi:RNA polymerase sigma factor (sigma-70 family)
MFERAKPAGESVSKDDSVPAPRATGVRARLPQAEPSLLVNPASIDRLLTAHARGDDDHVDAAWRAFVAEYTRLLMHVTRSVTANHDDAMDAYAFVLEQLRADSYRRLREFAADPRSKLSTWLVVVARRLCLDLYRHRYGRRRGEEPCEQRDMRRRLHDLIGGAIEPNDLPSPRSGRTEMAIREAELRAGLEDALSALSARDRLLLRLRFEDDMTAQEIARLLQLPSPFHVYRRLNVVLASLRVALQRRGIESAIP